MTGQQIVCKIDEVAQIEEVIYRTIFLACSLFVRYTAAFCRSNRKEASA